MFKFPPAAVPILAVRLLGSRGSGGKVVHARAPVRWSLTTVAAAASAVVVLGNLWFPGDVAAKNKAISVRINRCVCVRVSFQSFLLTRKLPLANWH